MRFPSASLSRYFKSREFLAGAGAHVRLTESPTHHGGSRLEPLGSRANAGTGFSGDAWPIMDKKNNLRAKLLETRRQLTWQDQRKAALGVCTQLAKLPRFITSRTIGAYIANGPEINPQPFIEHCWSMGKQVYLPVLDPLKPGHLIFMKYNKGDVLARNRMGILEPHPSRDTRCPPWTLDLVLTPLVGFDVKGHRIGMGGGFYDRTFAFMNRPRQPRKPTLIGIAHECQKQPNIPTESWDIPLQGIATGKALYLVN